MKIDLGNKRALVTGATGGIGEAITAALLNAGAEVVVSGTRIEKLAEMESKLGSLGKIVTMPCNLGVPEDITGLVSELSGLDGGIDILINNAGITRDGLLLRMDEQDWQTVLDINLKACMLLSKGLLRNMLKKRWGRIINITSVVGSTGNPGQANYAAAKAGLIGFSKSLAQEVANRGITVNCLAPGFIETEMTNKLSEDRKKVLLGNIPMQKMGQPEDISYPVLFLASEQASYITGQSLHVNGGLAMI
ncbi:MAG: 3-oxoacyl-[acyl-carrier-protein] reductase [Rhodobacteraceae bacterium]|nr:3-oxoacyl-[acyl-carrier-protein] reductase [Paracoccaceae bacterium]MCY4250169.1 3-oxoacyl-[acyl-carrier-protein] reductase [Paracoccaceae bacterium]MCY4308188.1 3-oxoacyl-[acyl-carrier-protein] reductase [Paracoccaceae bacterium]